MPGIRLVEYLPTKWVDKAAYLRCIGGVYNHQSTIPTITGKDWLKAPLLCEQQLWTENFKESKHGGYYDISVTGQLAGWTTAGAGELNKTVNYTFLLRLTCNDGQKWLLGSLESPFRFKSSATSGRKLGEFKGHNVIWYSKQAHKAVGYVPIF